MNGDRVFGTHRIEVAKPLTYKDFALAFFTRM
jgi:hypothetical protein